MRQRGPKDVDKNSVIITAHDFEGYKPGLCSKCNLDHLHPTHHKGKLNAQGWPKERKPERLKASAGPTFAEPPKKDK